MKIRNRLGKDPANSSMSMTVLMLMITVSFMSAIIPPDVSQVVGLGPGGSPSSRAGIVQWVQSTPDDFKGSGSNLAQLTGMIVNDTGAFLASTDSYWNQSDWSGGPNIIYASSDPTGFVTSNQILYTQKGELSLLISPVWGQKAPLLQKRGTLKAVWDPTHKQAIVFGGYAWIASTRTLLNKTEYYNPLTNTWTTGASTPPGRQSPAAAWDSTRGKMWVFGGNDGGAGQLSDAWYLTPGAGTGGTWSKVATCAEPMQNGNAVYDPSLDRLVAHGRSNYQVTIYNPAANTYSEGNDAFNIRDGAGGTWLPDDKLFMIVNGVEYAGKPETGFYAPGNNTWISGPNNPPFREYPTLVWDDLHKIAILYGGTKTGGTDGLTNEIWLYDPTTNSWTLLPNSSGPSVYGHGAVWDPDNHQMLVIGGINTAGETGAVYSMKLQHSPQGWLESSTYDTGGIGTIKKISWNIIDAPAGVGSQPVKFQIGSTNSGTPSVFLGPDGTSSTYFTTSGTGETGQAFHTGDRYLAYRVYLNTANQDYTPKVGNISIEYTSYSKTGSMVSPVFDTGITNMNGLEASWDADVPMGSNISVYIRSSQNSDMSLATNMFKLTDGTPFSDGVINQYIQYKVEMTSSVGGVTPTLKKMSITVNRAPTLDGGGHTPASGGPSTLFTFSVVYTDLDSTVPSQSAVFIDNVPEVMTSTGSGSISTGKMYEYKTHLAIGAHSYYFQFNDSFGAVRHPTGNLIVIVKDAPTLTLGSVNPSTGDSNTLFKFSVKYSDKDGLPASESNLTLDTLNTYHMATQDDGSAGYYLYTYAIKLAVGSHHYSFDFSNGVNNVLLPDTGSYNGPTVTGSASPLEVIQITPRDGGTGIPLTAGVSAVFNHSLLEYTVDKTTFILKDSNDTTISGTYLYKPSTYEAVFTPSTSLQYDTLYSVTITQGVLDSNWSCLPSVFQSTFRTIKKNAPPVNKAPVVTPVMNLEGTAGKSVSIKLNASDPNGDTLAYKIISGPSGPTVNAYGFFTWATKTKDAGDHDFVIEVTDGEFKVYIMLTVTLKKGKSNPGNQNMSMIALAVGLIIAVVVSILVVLLIMRSKTKKPVQPVAQAPSGVMPPPPGYSGQPAQQSIYDGVPIQYAEDRPKPQDMGAAARPQGVKQEEFYSTWEKPARPGLDKEYAFKAPVSTALAPKVMTKAMVDAQKASMQKSSDSKKVTIDGTAYTRVDILKIISSLPRGLPSELWGKDLDDLADEILNGEYSMATDGSPIVKLGRKWFNADPKDTGSYMRPYKGERRD